MSIRRRVPIVLQQDQTECSAACLAMVLGYHGRPTRLDECRDRCGSGRDGGTALAIAQAARSFGLRARGFSSQSTDLSDVDLPVIAFWKFNHFIVIERWRRGSVDIIDPALGRQRLTAKEFDEGFTGVLLAFEPGERFDREGTEATFTWKRYLQFMARARRIRVPLVQIVLASLLLQVLGLALPIFTKVVIDEVLPFGIVSLLPALGLGMLLWVGAQAIVSYLRSTLLIYVSGRLDAHVMLGFFEHLLSLPYGFFQRRASGDILMRLSSNTVLREVMTTQTLSAILDGGLVLGYLVVLLALEPLFGGIVIAIGAVQVGLLIGTTPRIHRLMQRDLKTQAESQGYLVEALHGVATLKASGAEDHAVEQWSNLFFKHLNVSIRRNHLTALIDMGMGALRVFSPLFLLWVGAQLVLDGRMTLGTMLALNALAAAFLSPLASLVANGQALQLVGAHFERIGDVLEAEPEQRGGGPCPADVGSARIELEGVGFRYDPAASWALEDVSLSIEPGQKVALVGPTGSGKSTIARLLLGLYPPTEGRVLVGGVPLDSYELRDWRRQFGVVLQEPFLFSGSIRQNLSLSDAEVPMELVEEAARLAAIDEEIAAMPMGFETVISEGGSALSGGQRQRLAIARALVRKPAILLLDEATSHLDVVTEGHVDENLSRLASTRIVIAHRLNTVRNADRIYVIEGGRVVEAGKHDELISRDGFYARMVERQASPAPSPPGR